MGSAGTATAGATAERKYSKELTRSAGLRGALVCALAICALQLVSHGARAQGPSADETGGATLQGLEDITQLDLEDLLAAPVVISASRRAQSLHEAPAAVSVITAEQLQQMGVRNPAEALARVVGVDVVRLSHNQFEVGMRGHNGLNNNRVLVIADDMSTRDIWGPDRPAWSTLPLHVQDIERIEVLRGPGSTLYGANALSGVVSIRGKRPLDHPGLQGFVRGGVSVQPEDTVVGPTPASIDTDRSWAEPLPRSVMTQREGFAAYGWRNASATFGVRASAFAGQPREHFQLVEALRIDGEQRWGTRLALDWAPGISTRLEVDMGHVMQEIPLFGFSHFTWNGSSTRTQTARAQLSQSILDGDLEFKSSMSLRRASQHLRTRPTDYLQLAGDPSALEAQARTEATANLWAQRLTLSGTLEGSVQDNRYFPDAEAQLQYLAAVLRQELLVSRNPSLRFNAGLRSETIRIQQDGQSADSRELQYHNLNWRAGLVWKVSEDQDLRLSASTAYRTPSPFQSLSGMYVENRNRGLDGFYYILPRSDLRPEQVLALEIGHRIRPGRHLRSETVGHCQRVDHLSTVYPRTDESFPIYFEDDHGHDQCGVELSAHLAAGARLIAYANYSGLWTVHTRGRDMAPLFPPHILNLGATWRIPLGLVLHMNGHAATGHQRTSALIFVRETSQVRRESEYQIQLNASLARKFLSDRLIVQLTARDLSTAFREGDSRHETPLAVPSNSSIELSVLFQETP